MRLVRGRRTALSVENPVHGRVLLPSTLKPAPVLRQGL